MSAFKVGVQLHPQAVGIDDLRAAWMHFDSIGVDSLWLWDHFFPIYGDPDGKHFECWSLLAAMALDTVRATIGPMVTPTGFRNPNLLADMARTIDHLSDGRFVLGLGAGWSQRDYDDYGFEFGDAPARLRQLRGDIDVIVDRLGKLNPPPVGQLPLLLAGEGERVSIPMVARYASAHNLIEKTPAEVRRLNAVLDECCRTIGRTPSEIERTVMVDPDVNPDDWLDSGSTHLIVLLGSPFESGPIEALLKWRDEANARR